MLHCLMLNVPLFHMVLVAIGIVVVSLLNVMLFGCCTIGCRIVLTSNDFNFAIVFAALFNVALLHYFAI